MKLWIAEGTCESCGKPERVEVSSQDDAYCMLNHQHDCPSPRIFDVSFREKPKKKRKRRRY